MKTLRYGGASWRGYLRSRNTAVARGPRIEPLVAGILRAVRGEGDRALVRLTERFDGVRLRPSALRVPAAEVRALARRVDPAVAAALRRMASRVHAFHAAQKGRGFALRLRGGSVLEERVRPIDSAEREYICSNSAAVAASTTDSTRAGS